MKYIFNNIEGDLKDAIFNNVLDTKGLWLPKNIPLIDDDFLESCSNYSFIDISKYILKKYIPNYIIPENDLENIIEETYNFEPHIHDLNENISILELFHGPTLSFKDYGVNFMSNLYNYLLKENVNVINATSGDTGSAVANAFYNKKNIKVFVLYPKDKISLLQEKQIATLGKNVFPIEIDGSFDDCQFLVKKVLNQSIDAKNKFISANSINIARLLPQITYYFYTYAKIQTKKKLVVCVPSGNLGNLTAGLLAKKMGLPIDKFICALNSNNTFYNYLNTGSYLPQKSVKTISNAMDIGDPSNFLRINKLFSFDELSKILKSYYIDDKTTIQNIENIFKEYNYTLDPHTSVGYCALKNYINENSDKDNKYILLSTAHPIKFEKEIKDNVSKPVNINKPKNVNIDILMNKKSIKFVVKNNINSLNIYMESIINLKGNIILIGMPYSGKTTVGKQLALEKNKKFIDTDILIEKKYNKPLIEILNQFGNEDFLNIEEDIIKSIKGDNLIISTGGSVIYRENAMNYLNTMYGNITYLEISFDTFKKRCYNFSQRGVVLKNNQSLRDLYNERVPLYQKYKDITINNN